MTASNLFCQTPAVKTIDGVTYFCYTRAQAETLAVKLLEANQNIKELQAAHAYIELLEKTTKQNNEMNEYNNKLLDAYKQQVKDYESLTDDNSWLDSRPIWAGLGALSMYLAVRAAAGIK